MISPCIGTSWFRMRDGIHLATDIYRPAVGGRPVETPLPVIMERTPYGKTRALALGDRARDDAALDAGRSRDAFRAAPASW